jgi:hypothetical protein
MKVQLLRIAIAATVILAGCSKKDPVTYVNPSKEASYYDNKVPTQWMDLELRLIKTTSGFTPPVAARALGYSGLALYEAVAPGTDLRSAGLALNYSYVLPFIDKTEEYNWALAASAAMKEISLNLFANTTDANKASIDSLYDAQYLEVGSKLKNDVIARSVNYGKDVAQVIFEWSKTDNGHMGYSTNFPNNYTVPTGTGYWVPTPPAYQAIPLQPFWGENRPFLAVNVSANCIPPAPVPYSPDANSLFYAQALEVYTTNLSLSQEEKDIALFWSDGGNTYTPPGHIMNIGTTMLREKNQRLDKCAEVYLRMGMALSDAFVACWKGKYQYNVMRPVTYIRQNIDATWMPLIATPPFPEYGSGHSTASGAASEVLTAMFGNNVSFTDHTNDAFGFAPRTFSSFYEAASEAAVSRLYGGIHYRAGNERGLKCGKEIGKNIVGIDLRK